MRTLYLTRHAKSSWDDPDTDDFHRALNARGERDPFIIRMINLKLTIDRYVTTKQGSHASGPHRSGNL